MVIIEAKLTGKGRPRFYRGHAITPKNTKEYEKKVAMEYKRQNGQYFSREVPLEVHIEFFKKVPKSYTKKDKKAIEDGYKQFISKPDIDNLIKSILDGLNGIAYEDDSQIVKVNATKKYTFQEERAEIEVKEYKI